MTRTARPDTSDPGVTPPAGLGRGVIVVDDDPTPVPWNDCDEVVIDDAVLAGPSDTVATLHRAWSSRTPVVVRLRVDPVRFRRPGSREVNPWELDPTFEFFDDRLQFLVWTNNYDARTGEAIWWWSRKAERLGASAVDDDTCDITLEDGTPAWVDGGPPDSLDPDTLDAGVIRAESVAIGRLELVPSWVEPNADLAPDQLAAVAHRGGPARIIAPAGSGKTRVLTERLRHLVGDRHVGPSGVVAVAYNRKAADEMAERTQDLAAAGRAPEIRTLNALGYAILGRRYGRRPSLIDEREMRRRLEPLLPKLSHRLNTDPMAPYLEGLSAVRLGLRDPEVVEEELDAPGLTLAIEPYRAGLRADGVIDFDEQIVHAIECLCLDGEFRRAEQDRHRHLLVDEFQDLTPAHVLLVRLLASPTFDVFGVGDDDQCIYGHAGATPRFLVDFAELFPGAGEHALTVNYRCPADVVVAARTMLGYNHHRVDKTIEPDRGDAGDPALVLERHATDAGAAAVIDAVQRRVDAGAALDEIAVLTRTNSLLLAPHVGLVDAGIPVASVLRSDVLRRVGLRAALAWLRIATDPGNVSGADLTEVARRPSRGFPRWVDKWLTRCRSGHEVAKAATRIDDARVSQRMVDLADDIARLGEIADGASTRDVLIAIRDEIGLGGAMELLDGRPGAEGSSHIDDLDALLQVADIQPDPELFEIYLRRALDPDPSTAGSPSSPEGPPAAVTLSTIHRVKGREWPHVLVFGANDGSLPHRLAEDVEEERRVFHVGITRGISSVTVLADRDRPSEFLGELDGSAPRTERRPTPVARNRAANVLTPSGGGSSTSSSKAPLSGEEAVLFEELRKWRAEVAKRQGGPAFIVFGDATLTEIARTRPEDLRSLAKVKGVGPTKLDNYGDDVLAVVAQFA